MCGKNMSLRSLLSYPNRDLSAKVSVNPSFCMTVIKMFRRVFVIHHWIRGESSVFHFALIRVFFQSCIKMFMLKQSDALSGTCLVFFLCMFFKQFNVQFTEVPSRRIQCRFLIENALSFFFLFYFWKDLRKWVNGCVYSINLFYPPFRGNKAGDVQKEN